MPLSSKDIEEINKESFKEPRFAGFLIGIVRLMTKIPIIKNKVNNSYGGLSGSIFHCWKNNDYKKATQISVYALERFRNKKDRFAFGMEHHYWWQFMKHGVDSAKHLEDPELRKKLITMANNGIEPFEGYDVAYSFLEFSRWKYLEKNYEESIKFAEVASSADKTWANPEFILGWYSLLLDRGNAEEHLIRAIERDQRIISLIENNKTCKRHPHLIEKLKLKYSIKDTDNGSNQPN